jgi:hypothetical protein
MWNENLCVLHAAKTVFLLLRALIKKHGFATAQRTQFFIYLFLHFIFEFFWFFKIVSYTKKGVKFNGKNNFP